MLNQATNVRCGRQQKARVLRTACMPTKEGMNGGDILNNTAEKEVRPPELQQQSENIVYGVAGTKQAEFCVRHAHEGMLNVRSEKFLGFSTVVRERFRPPLFVERCC